MGRKRAVVAEPPKDEAADEGFDVAPEFKYDETPDTEDDDPSDYGC